MQEKCGYGETLGRIMAHQLWRWGENFAAEIREGRKLRAGLDRMAKAEGRSALVMSRRAKDLGETYRCLEAGHLLVEGAIEKAGLPLTELEFGELVALAGARDQAACCELARTCRRLAPHLPEQRGRPISDATCIHLFLERQLESWGHNCAYTPATNGAGFTDPVTRATQLASGNGGFSPLHANRLRKKTILPPVPLMDPSLIERFRPNSAARAPAGRQRFPAYFAFSEICGSWRILASS